mgnify:CR=1 FL=1
MTGKISRGFFGWDLVERVIAPSDTVAFPATFFGSRTPRLELIHSSDFGVSVTSEDKLLGPAERGPFKSAVFWKVAREEAAAELD